MLTPNEKAAWWRPPERWRQGPNESSTSEDLKFGAGVTLALSVPVLLVLIFLFALAKSFG